MTQLVVRPGRNAARQAKKLKEIRKVKGAIAWTERERKKRQELSTERWESKQAVIQLQKWKNENVIQVRRKALQHAKQDWQLGPLRPNRAVGPDADKYGALTKQQMQKPDIPVHTQKNRNEARAKRGLDPKYPLVVDDEKYFHIVKDDRVVIVKGREKGKIGMVQNVIARTHEIIVKGVNMQYYDSNVFNSTGEAIGPMRESEVPISIDDVRLVIPYEITKDGQRTFSDVIVDNVLMERHTTGVDPFTGTDYGDAEIPEEHQYDPQTGLPIFHRYIAGTTHRIEWPWEQEEVSQDSDIKEEGKTDTQSRLRRTMNAIRSPIATFKRMTTKDNATVPDTDVVQTDEHKVQKLREVEEEEQARRKERPRSDQPFTPEAYELTDTTRNIVEGAESMAYSLVAPPFPDTLGDELRSDIRQRTTESNKGMTKDRSAGRRNRPRIITEQSIAAAELNRARQVAAQQMKTPMQLRWEVEHAKKLKMQKESPLVKPEDLMLALGQHMQKAKEAKRNQGANKAEDLD